MLFMLSFFFDGEYMLWVMEIIVCIEDGNS